MSDSAPPADSTPGDDTPPAGDTPPASQNNTPPPKADDDPPYPPNTPVADMSKDEQIAYYKHHAAKHERIWKSKTGSDLSPEKFKEMLTELDTLRDSTRTDSEKAIEAARVEGRNSVVGEFNNKIIDTHIGVFLSARGVKREDVPALDAIDTSKFIDANNDVDTEKLASVLESLTGPATGSAKKWPDTGQGNRGTRVGSKGVAAGADLYSELRKKK